MAPIDLKEFALKEQKVSKRLLFPETQKGPTPTWKILGAHYLDFLAVAFFTSFSAAVFNQSIKLFMNTKSLRLAFDEHATLSLASSLLPMMLFSYFFLSYFLNQGQTWGMFTFKKRMKMPSQSFRDAFYWAAHSLFMCLTGGLFYLAKREEWQNLQKHDYLYHEMLLHREDYSIDLLKRIDEQEVVKEYARAA